MSDSVLRLERLIAAAPERVFEWWTDPELLARWFGPDGYAVPSYALDVRPGGRWHTALRSPAGTLVTVRGVYRAIEPPRRLVFTWAWDQDDGSPGPETEVTVTFETAPGGTKLVLLQQPFEDRKSRDNHRAGWSSSFDCLERSIAGKTI